MKVYHAVLRRHRRTLQRLYAPPGAIMQRPSVRRAVHRPRWGNLRRSRPFSARYGFDRGTPVDRHYMHIFFEAHAHHLRGRVLEICNPEFTGRFGTDISSLDLLDIDPRNDSATIIADLAETESLPLEAFDCIVLPQTLQYVSDVDTALANAWQALAPGGTLLVSVPAVSKIDHHARTIDRWRILPEGLTLLLERNCPSGRIDVQAFGNLLAATAFLLGLTAEELKETELATNDVDYPVLTCGAVQKPSQW